MGTGRDLSNGRVASQPITVRVRRPPHGRFSAKFTFCYYNFRQMAYQLAIAKPRLTSGAFDFVVLPAPGLQHLRFIDSGNRQSLHRTDQVFTDFK